MQAVEISDEELLQERIANQRARLAADVPVDGLNVPAAASSSSATDLASAFSAMHFTTAPISAAERARLASVTLGDSGAASASASSFSPASVVGSADTPAVESLRITVDDPEVRSTTFTKYVAYAVTVYPKLPRVINVRRRYNDFCWLREVLVRHYPGYFVPPLPPKKALGRFNEDFLDERQEDLQRFMNRVCQDPILPDNPAFRMFLCRHENSFEQGQREVETALAQDLVMSGTLADRYAKLLPKALSSTLPESLPEEMLRLRELLDRSEVELMALLETARLIGLKRKEDAAEKARLAVHMQAVYKTETQYAERPEPARIDISEALDQWAKITAQTVRPYDACFVNTIKYELQDVQAFIEIMNVRNDLLASAIKAKARADGWRTPDMQGKPLSDKQQKNKAEDFLSEEDLTGQLRVVDQVIRDNTLHQTWLFKVSVFQKAVVTFAQSELENARKAVTVWQECLSRVSGVSQ